MKRAKKTKWTVMTYSSDDGQHFWYWSNAKTPTKAILAFCKTVRNTCFDSKVYAVVKGHVKPVSGINQSVITGSPISHGYSILSGVSSRRPSE